MKNNHAPKAPGRSVELSGWPHLDREGTNLCFVEDREKNCFVGEERRIMMEEHVISISSFGPCLIDLRRLKWKSIEHISRPLVPYLPTYLPTFLSMDERDRPS